VLDAAEWHINADEPDLLDYDTSFKSATQDGFFEPNQFRSADHDPLVVTLCADLTACAADRVEAVADEIEALIAANPGSALARRLEIVLKKVEDAVAELTGTPPDRQGAIVKLESAAGDVENAVKQAPRGIRGRGLARSASPRRPAPASRCARGSAWRRRREDRGRRAGTCERRCAPRCGRLQDGDHELQAGAVEGGRRVGACRPTRAARGST